MLCCPGEGQRLAVGQTEQEFGWAVVFGVLPSTLFGGLSLEQVWKEAMLILQRHTDKGAG